MLVGDDIQVSRLSLVNYNSMPRVIGPDENHWILKPGNAIVRYETVPAFLDPHVLGKEWKRPELL